MRKSPTSHIVLCSPKHTGTRPRKVNTLSAFISVVSFSFCKSWCLRKRLEPTVLPVHCAVKLRQTLSKHSKNDPCVLGIQIHHQFHTHTDCFWMSSLQSKYLEQITCSYYTPKYNKVLTKLSTLLHRHPQTGSTDTWAYPHRSTAKTFNVFSFS